MTSTETATVLAALAIRQCLNGMSFAEVHAAVTDLAAKAGMDVQQLVEAAEAHIAANPA